MKRLAGVLGPVALVLLGSTAARAAVVACGTIDAVQGGDAVVTISLEVEGEEVIAGVQNDLQFDAEAFGIANFDCVINPAIGPGTEPDKRLSTSLPPGEVPTVRNLVVALDNSNAIPTGALYTCAFHVSGEAAVGEYTLTNVNVRASNPEGMVVPTTAGNCTINVHPAPTPTPTAECEENDDCPEGEVCVDNHCVTPTPTRTNTPIGFCNDNEDCPEGQVCVNNMCVTATPTRTPIGYCTDNDDCPLGQVCVNNMCVTPTPTRTPIGFCTDNEDCPLGQVCVDNMCVAVTPTATPKKKSGGGGCSCEIDPGATGGRGGHTGDMLAVLLPALVLALRWQRRRRA